MYYKNEVTGLKLIIIRHGDPDYVLDSLTKKGKKEASLLCEKMENLNPDYIYSSPLGRAKKTAKIACSSLKKDIVVLPWLREFEGRIGAGFSKDICWDRLPGDWTQSEGLYTEKWYDCAMMKNTNVRAEYEKVAHGLDELLLKHGYEHNGRLFNVIRPNHDTIVLFCHFAVACVILSHLLSVSPMPLWHNFAALPTSVTTVVTEERRKGTAVFRILSFGDTGHLYKGNEEPSFACRFCECFDDDTRHD